MDDEFSTQLVASETDSSLRIEWRHKKHLDSIRLFIDFLQKKLASVPGSELISIETKPSKLPEFGTLSIVLSYINKEQGLRAKKILDRMAPPQVDEEEKKLFQKRALLEERLSGYSKFGFSACPNEIQSFFHAAKENLILDSTLSIFSKRCIAHLWLRRQLLAPSDKKVRRAEIKILKIDRGSLLVVVGIHFLRDREFFDEKDLLRLVQKEIPDAEMDAESLIIERRLKELVKIFSITLKRNEGSFSSQNIAWMRRDLGEEIKAHVEVLVPSLFMPRNEEEIMRNIVTLGRELKFVRDLPQVIITFDHQSKTSLFFTIIWVTLTKLPSGLFENRKEGSSHCKFIPDREKVVGLLRKRHKKQAIVFRAKFRKEEFLRPEGHAIDLNRARLFLAKELFQILGPFRDYNGGMISEQQELYRRFLETLKGERSLIRLAFLDHFFYSITPLVFQTSVDPCVLKELYYALKEAMRLAKSAKAARSVLRDLNGFLALAVASEEHHIFEQLEKEIRKIAYRPLELLRTRFNYQDMKFCGLLVMTEEAEIRNQFLQLHKKLL